MTSYKPFLLTAALAVALASSACANRDEPPNTTTTGTAQGTVDLAADLRVDDVETGRAIGADKNILDEVEEFSPTDTIYAAVRTLGAATGARLTARWMFQDTLIVQEQDETISPKGDAYTAFHIAQITPRRIGKYKLIVLLNGREVDDEEFTVK